MAGACPLSDFWSATRGVVVVRLTAAVWECGRIYCAGDLLLFSRDNPQRGSLVRGAGDGGGLGRLRGNLHGYRSRAHPLCAAGSRALELAAHCFAGSLVCPGDRVAILAAGDSSPCARVHAVLGAYA